MKLKLGKKRGKRMTLNQLKVGNSAVITTVGGDGALRCRLLDMGLIPHTRVTLQKVAPMVITNGNTKSHTSSDRFAFRNPFSYT